MEVLCDHEACRHSRNGECYADGISITGYSEYPDDIECNTFEEKEKTTDGN
jgi:hypothetical protein